MTTIALRDFYLEHLFTVLVPFWINRGIDRVNGGFFTCFNNTGDRLVARHKYLWSQGRFLWMLSRLRYGFRDYMDPATFGDLCSAADGGARFLKRHALLPNGNCAWVLDETGMPIITDRGGTVRAPAEGDRYDPGITADQFLIYGMGEYSRAVNSREHFLFALNLFDSVLERLATGSVRSFPHDRPRGYKVHAEPMIMLETAQELADVAEFFNHPSVGRLRRVARNSMAEVLTVFLREEPGLIIEGVKQDNRSAFDEMIGSYINPGHALEDAWFIMHLAGRTGDRRAGVAATEIVATMTSRCWDHEYGGLPLFLHKDGGPPRGAIAEQNRDDHMILELTENWSNKLWWVHSEALYALILAWERTGNRDLLKTYWMFHRYVFETFPNPDPSVGEWIQIRDRRGQPEDKIVALPVKDPYHIVRAIMHIVKVLERRSGEHL